MASALSNLFAVLSLDTQSYLDSLNKTKKKTDSFLATFANVGGAVALGALTTAATAVTAVGTAAWNAGETMDSAMDTISVATGATGPELQALEEDFKAVFRSVPTDSKTAADAIGILNARLDVTGPVLQEVAEPLLEVSRILGGDAKTNAELFTRVMGDWNIPVENGANALDTLFVAAQKTGAPFDQLLQQVVQYGAPMRNFGFSMTEAGALLASFAAQGVNTEIVMSGLRTAQGKFIKDGVEMSDGLWDTIQAIQTAETQTDALTIATEVFGAKAAGDMLDTIRAGKFDLNDLTKAMESADGAIMETAASTMDWGEKWTIFKNKATVALAPIGASMMDGVGQALDEVVALFERPDVQSALTKFAEGIGTMITKAVEYIPILIDGFFKFVDFLKNNEGIVVAVLVALGAAAVVWAATSIAAAWSVIVPMLPVIAVILLIAAAAYLLYEAWTNNWGGIQEKTQVVIDFIKGLIDSGMQFIHDIVEGRMGMLSLIFTTVWSNIQLLFAAFQAAFSGDWYRFGELLRTVWDNNWTMMRTVLATAWTNIQNAVRNGITAAKNLFTQTNWAEVGRNILQGVANGIKGAVSIVTTAARNAAAAALEAIKGFLGIKSPSTVFEAEVGWQMAAGAAAGWERGLDRMFSVASLDPSALDTPSRGAVATETSAGASGSTDDLLLREVRQLLRNLPQEIARSLRDTSLRGAA